MDQLRLRQTFAARAAMELQRPVSATEGWPGVPGDAPPDAELALRSEAQELLDAEPDFSAELERFGRNQVLSETLEAVLEAAASPTSMHTITSGVERHLSRLSSPNREDMREKVVGDEHEGRRVAIYLLAAAQLLAGG